MALNIAGWDSIDPKADYFLKRPKSQGLLFGWGKQHNTFRDQPLTAMLPTSLPLASQAQPITRAHRGKLLALLLILGIGVLWGSAQNVRLPEMMSGGTKWVASPSAASGASNNTVAGPNATIMRPSSPTKPSDFPSTATGPNAVAALVPALNNNTESTNNTVAGPKATIAWPSSPTKPSEFTNTATGPNAAAVLVPALNNSTVRLHVTLDKTKNGGLEFVHIPKTGGSS